MKKELFNLNSILLALLFATMIMGCAGRDGEDGLQGAPGINGIDGAPGADGSDGVDAQPDPYAVKEIIDPCGKQAAYDEVILRLNNGVLLSHYSDGAKQFMVVLSPGSYRTTDGTNCLFHVSATKQVTY